jgi:hypothetical protein
MTNPHNDRYQRHFPDPDKWASNKAFTDRAVEQTRLRINELSWAIQGEQTAENAALWTRAPHVGDEVEAHLKREARREAAQAEGFKQGEPGE